MKQIHACMTKFKGISKQG